MKYIKIAVWYLAVFFVVVTINFALPRLAPGDPALYLAGDEYQFMNDEEKQEVLREFDLDRPVSEQYLRYLSALFNGDWGYSIIYGRPVRDVLLTMKAPFTLLLMGTALIVTSILSVSLGVISAWRRGRKSDIALMSGVMICNSFPAFWVAMLLITLFSATLGWLPSHGAAPLGARPGSAAYFIGVTQRLILPVLSLVIVQTGGLYLTTRASLMTTLEEDFVMLAYARGLKKKAVMLRHALPNALLPIFTNFMHSLGHLIGGAVVIETVFSYPGIGKTIHESVFARDFPLLQGAFLLVSTSVLLANLLTDLIYPRLDPRVGQAIKEENP